MKSFLIITHLSPKAIRSSLRQGLIENMERSLHQQSYANWKALWIGEEESVNGKIKTVRIEDRSQLSTIYLRDDVKSYLQDCDYIVKLDDDDVILPDTLQIASGLSFDCYCDAFHTFYDISSGSLTQQKRPWIASTCVHKREHAMKDLKGGGHAENFINSLFYGEHGKDWIGYYQDKKIVYADKKMPVYVRILSPTSITAGAKKFPVLDFADVDLGAYYRYLKTFGAWLPLKLTELAVYHENFKAIWEKFSGRTQAPIQGISMTEKIKDRLRGWLK